MCVSFLETNVSGLYCFFLTVCLVETAGVLVGYFGWWIFVFPSGEVGGPKILLLIIDWVLDVLRDFGMGFLSQDLGFFGGGLQSNVWGCLGCFHSSAGKSLAPGGEFSIYFGMNGY